MSQWTITEGLNTVRALEKVLARKGYHVALGGGVLLRDVSLKDLDVLVYPHRTSDMPDNFDVARRALEDTGVEQLRKCDHSYDRKDVWRCILRGKRIDFFFVQ